MYVLNKDVPSLVNTVDKYIYDNGKSNYKEFISILDIRYFKTFTSKAIVDILGLNTYDEKNESIFLDVCMSSILSNSRDTELIDIVIHTCDLLIEVFNNNCIELNKIELREQLFIYIDVLRNNIDYMLDSLGLMEYERMSVANLIRIDNIDKFYIVKDLSLDTEVSEIRSNSLYLKLYERVNNGPFLK